MANSEDNLLLALSRCSDRQEENFTTEAFSYLLRHLARNEPRVAVTILDSLVDGSLRFAEEDCRTIQISTQQRSPEGRPDIEIVAPDLMMIVEVKVQADLGRRQLESYWEILKKSSRRKKRLVLLTRFFLDLDLDIKQPVYKVRWYKIAECLECERANLLNPISLYLSDQFLSFLRGKGMTMDQVGWELFRGIQSLANLRDMLNETLKGLGGKITPGGGLNLMGFGCHWKSRHFWVGIEFAEPGMLHFYEYQGKIKGSEIAHESINLTSEDVHFFALSKHRQQELIEKFVRESLAKP